MLIEKTENAIDNDGKLTAKGIKIFKRRNIVKALFASIGVMAGIGGGIGVGYGIYHTVQSTSKVSFVEVELTGTIDNIEFVDNGNKEIDAVYTGSVSSLDGIFTFEINYYDWMYDVKTGKYSSNAYKSSSPAAYQIKLVSNDEIFYPFITTNFSLNTILNIYIGMRSNMEIQYINPENSIEENEIIKNNIKQVDLILSGSKGKIDQTYTQIFVIKDFDKFCALFHEAWIKQHS